MHRLASIGVLLAMTGCSHLPDSSAMPSMPSLPSSSDIVGNPLVGAGGFIADTHTYHRGPNRPVGDSDNMRRVAGQDMASDPLLPEEGNIWPGPIPADKTLADIEKQNAAEVLKSGEQLNLGNGGLSGGGAPSRTPATPSVTSFKPILVPNGNGTSMLIGPDGSVKTVPTPP